MTPKKEDEVKAIAAHDISLDAGAVAIATTENTPRISMTKAPASSSTSLELDVSMGALVTSMPVQQQQKIQSISEQQSQTISNNVKEPVDLTETDLPLTSLKQETSEIIRLSGKNK